MIKNIFIPERIDSYYLFSKRVAAFDIGLTEIHVTVALLKGRTRIIEKLLSERIETDSDLSQDERIIQALKLLATKMGPVDEISYAFPCSQVIFKELTLPFTGAKKIKMVVPFEVESLLPFSLDTAVIDSIVTHEGDSSTDLLVAAVKKEQIAHLIQLFQSAELLLYRISVDMFELYGLYKMVTPETHMPKNTALIDLGYHTTRIALIIDGQLKYIRSIPKGLVTAAKKLATLTTSNPEESLQHLMSFGMNEINDPSFSKQVQAALEELFAEINYTCESYLKKLKNPHLQEVLLGGAAADIPGISDFLATITHAKVHLFQPKQLLHNAIIQSKVTTLPNSFIVSTAMALAPETTQEFNLQKEEVHKEESKTINRQLAALAALICVLFLSFSLYSFLRIRTLKRTYKSSETEAINELKKSFNLKQSQTVNLQAANKAALSELKKQETTWSRLSTENRYAFLRYLAELSRCINLKDTQLALTSISLKDDTIKLYGSVPGYQQLTKLQNGLECPLFKKLPKLQDWNFKSDPIILTVNREET